MSIEIQMTEHPHIVCHPGIGNGEPIIKDTRIVDLMEPGAVYVIEWSTPPGDAEVDNASWEFGAGEHLGSIPILLSRCWVTRETWGVDPIRDGASHTFDAVSHCYRNLFVSWIWR